MTTLSRQDFRVGLRPLTLDDLDDIMGWINDPQVTRNFAGLSRTITRAEESAYLERTLADPNERLFAIVDGDGDYLGNVGIHRIYWPARNGRLGIVLGAPRARGQGYGYEALWLVCRWGFEDLGLNKLWVMHYADNARMAHITGRLGFVEEGRLRDEYFHEGVYHDMTRRSMLAREWAEAAG